VWNQPSEELLNRLPRLGSTEHTPLNDRVVHLHFFFGDCDWYATEYDGEDLFFGYVVLHNDMENAGWGRFSLSELKDINIYGFEIDHDIHWTPVPVRKIERIVKGRT
jgi:hypothetical protein